MKNTKPIHRTVELWVLLALSFAGILGYIFLLKYPSEKLPFLEAENFLRYKLFVVNRIKYMSLFFGMFFVLLFLFAMHQRKYGKSIYQELAAIILDAWKNIVQFFRNMLSQKTGLAICLLISSIGITAIFVRLYFSMEHIRLDEASTVVEKILNPFYKSLIYNSPNNHVLHTQLVRLSTALFGLNEFTVRIPALLAGILCIPLIFIATVKMFGRTYGWFAAAAMSVLPFTIMYDTVARGYSLVNLFFLLSIIVGQSIIKKISGGKILIFSVLITFGMFVMPSFLFAAAGLFIWISSGLLIQKTSISDLTNKFILPAGISLIGMTLILYSPVIILSGIDRIVANKYVVNLPWNEFFAKLPLHFSKVSSSMTHNIPRLFVFAGILSIILGLFHSWKSKNKIAFIFLPSIIIGAGIILITKMAIPFPRTWGFIIPATLMMMDAGIMQFVRKLNLKLQRMAAVVMISIMFFAAYQITHHNIISNYKDIGLFKEAEDVASFLSQHIYKEDKIEGLALTNTPTRFYWHLQGFTPQESPIKNYQYRYYYIIKNKSRKKLSDFTTDPVEKIYDFEGASIYVGPQTETRNNQIKKKGLMQN